MMTTMAAPIGTVSYGAPVTYAAAPVAANTYTTMAAPTVVETVAAPVTYAAAPAVAPSFIPGTMNIIPTPAAPVAPVKLTEGIPTPAQINSQKAGYSAALDKQLKEALETVQKETAIEKQMVQFNADKSIALFNNTADERLAQQIAAIDEENTFRTLELKKALVERGLQLDSQAQGLVMDYEVKALQTEWATKRYQFDLEYKKAEDGLQKQMDKQVAIANAAM